LDERALRARRVCQATKTRVQRGATVGPTDVEGWVVQLDLLRDAAKGSSVDAPELGTFVGVDEEGRGRLLWSDGTHNFAEPDALTWVDVETASYAPGDQRTGVRLVAHGRYVGPYFSEQERILYVRMATAMAEALGADVGALFARCDGDDEPQMASWFLGKGPGGAAASLIYSMGVLARVPHLRPELLAETKDAPKDPAFAWMNLTGSLVDLKQDRVATLIGSDGGMIALSSHGVVLRFPFKDANRAGRASLRMARALDIGTLR
jgi:serine/threonine-protein kinase